MPTFKNIKVPRMRGGKKVGTRLQRVQVLKSGKLKFVKNKPRGGKKASSKAPVKSKKRRSKSVAKKGNPNNKSPKIGAAIQAFKGAQPLLSPAIHAVAAGGSSEAAISHLKFAAQPSYAGNVAATAVNQVIDRKIAQGAALSRGSVTAWLPEAYLGFQVANEVRGQDARQAAIGANRKMARTINGYDPGTATMDLSDNDFRLYHGLKIGGGAARRLSNVGPFKRVMAPVKKFLGQMGGAL